MNIWEHTHNIVHMRAPEREKYKQTHTNRKKEKKRAHAQEHEHTCGVTQVMALVWGCRVPQSKRHTAHLLAHGEGHGLAGVVAGILQLLQIGGVDA